MASPSPARGLNRPRRHQAVATALACFLLASACSNANEPAQDANTSPADPVIEDSTTTTTTTVATTTTTTTTRPTTTTAADRLVVLPGESFTVDTSDWNLPGGTSLYLVEQNVEFPVWSSAGKVGPDTFTVPEFFGWRTTGLETAVVEWVRWPAGKFALMAYPSGPALTTIEVPVEAEATGIDPEEFAEAAAMVAPDPDLAILGPDGLAETRFGTPATEALDLLILRFGDPVEDGPGEIACEPVRQVRWDNGIVATFDSAGAQEFRSYAFFADDRTLDGERLEAAATRPAFTTAKGIGLGSQPFDFWLSVEFVGFYDTHEWGSRAWWTDDVRLGGTLDDDLTNGGVVDAIGAGRDWNPLTAFHC